MENSNGFDIFWRRKIGENTEEKGKGKGNGQRKRAGFLSFLSFFGFLIA